MSEENIYDVMGRHILLDDMNVEGVRAVRPPPAGFDPRKADRSTLLRHGITPRPNPQTSPRATAIWDRLAEQSFEYIVPVLTPLRDEKDKPSAKSHHELERMAGGAADSYSSNWSGGLIFNGNTATDPFRSIYGEWVVPSVMPPVGGDGDWWSVAWIGVDGYGSSDVMQVGTAQHVNVSGGRQTTQYFAWVEWYTYGWNSIALTVNPGDCISANLSNLGVQNGALSASGRVTNLTTGQTTAVAVTAPPGTIFQGNVAEWIMERPSFGNTVATLPRFGMVAGTLTACTASKVYSGGNATPIDMTSNAQSTGTLYAGGGVPTELASTWYRSS